MAAGGGCGSAAPEPRGRGAGRRGPRRRDRDPVKAGRRPPPRRRRARRDGLDIGREPVEQQCLGECPRDGGRRGTGLGVTGRAGSAVLSGCRRRPFAGRFPGGGLLGGGLPGVPFRLRGLAAAVPAADLSRLLSGSGLVLAGLLVGLVAGFAGFRGGGGRLPSACAVGGPCLPSGVRRRPFAGRFPGGRLSGGGLPGVPGRLRGIAGDVPAALLAGSLVSGRREDGDEGLRSRRSAATGRDRPGRCRASSPQGIPTLIGRGMPCRVPASRHRPPDQAPGFRPPTEARGGGSYSNARKTYPNAIAWPPARLLPIAAPAGAPPG